MYFANAMSHRIPSFSLLRGALTAGIIAALQGCASAPPQEAPKIDRVGLVLEKHASVVSAAMQRMGEAEGQNRLLDRKKQPAARASIVATQPDKPANGSVRSADVGMSNIDPAVESAAALSQIVALNELRGSAEEVLDQVCAQINWKRTASTGVRVAPIMISLPAGQRPLLAILKDVGAQLGRNADVVISSDSKSLSISYSVN